MPAKFTPFSCLRRRMRLVARRTRLGTAGMRIHRFGINGVESIVSEELDKICTALGYTLTS